MLYIPKQLFASVSVNSGGYLPRRSCSHWVNIHRYSSPLRRIIVKYPLCTTFLLIFVFWLTRVACTRSDQCLIPPAASQLDIFRHTVWGTWLFIAYSDRRWLYYQFLLPYLLLTPPGVMSLIIQAVFLSFFLSVKNVHFNWIIGFSGTRDVFFCREQIQRRDAGDVLWQNSSKCI